MKKSNVTSVLAAIVLSFFIAINFSGLKAQTTESKFVYILTFPEYEMMEIKPLVALTQPLFDTNIEIQDDNYKRFIYRSNNVVTEEQVKKALEGSKYTLTAFEVKK
jgi:hypothetical protein